MKWNQQRIGDRIDIIDAGFCRRGVLKPASWPTLLKKKKRRLYAGKLSWTLPQYTTDFGLSLGEASRRNIRHDVRHNMPIPDDSIDVYQAEDVFEHIPYHDISRVFDEIHRVLKPHGLFRLSVPDYRCDLIAQRVQRDKNGIAVFDPEGGGHFTGGKISGGGHLWFPVFETVRQLFDQSLFCGAGDVRFLHYTNADGSFILKDIDYSMGYIRRTPDHDVRAQNPPRPLSIVVDAIKL